MACQVHQVFYVKDHVEEANKIWHYVLKKLSGHIYDINSDIGAIHGDDYWVKSSDIFSDLIPTTDDDIYDVGWCRDDVPIAEIGFDLKNLGFVLFASQATHHEVAVVKSVSWGVLCREEVELEGKINATLIKVNSVTSLAELKMKAAENFRVRFESLLISYSMEKFPNISFELSKDEDILNMIGYHRSMGLNTLTMTVTERDEGPTHAIGTKTELKYKMKVTETNPGSVFSIEQEERRFKRLFVSYGACIQGFLKGCRPLLFLDGTFLKDRYKGILLGATAYDEPYNPPHPLVILSDADKGIKQSLKDIFLDAYHSRCVLHLVENYKLKLREMGFASSAAQRISKLLEFAAYKYTEGEFNAVLHQIRMTDQRAYQVALSYGPSNWANSVFPGIRYGHITSNVAESFNSWIRVARTLPICDMMDHIRVKIIERMNTCREMATKWNSYLCPEAEKILQENVTKGSTLEVSHSTAEIFEVSSTKSVQVDLEHKSCTCRAWDILRIPCKHACAAINFMHRDVYQFCDWFMTTEAFRRSYEPILFPVPNYDKPDVTDETISILPPKTTKRHGRNKNRRINNRSESRRVIRCSRCHAEGHNRATCTEPIED
ncbi:uncharacterized protein LOC109846064 [Asparagus officinalis]|uniref:uncharacterized protein LOC109846064 n=1 Tax=Asparagus officinalis TaxID=4686 RepID=UPI00098E4047|nr:uncharacterized protein LOC109846064 [Asparagus officinalis]